MPLTVLILGEGSLGRSIHDSLNFFSVDARILSIRKTKFLHSIFGCHFDVIVDCMDPGSIEGISYHDSRQYIDQLRVSILDNLCFHVYAYISSANIYAPSLALIDESSAVFDSRSSSISEYIQNKLITEIYLRGKLHDRLRIFRPVSLWKDRYSQGSQGFFPDLIRSRSNGLALQPRPNDEDPISYMHYNHAAQAICHALINMIDCFEVLNISASCWSSRQCLKNGSMYLDDYSQWGRRIVSSTLHLGLLPFSLRPFR